MVSDHYQQKFLADTAVALASSNALLFSRKVIGRLCRLIEKTCLSPTPTLEQHLIWDDIAILLRYLLMLSFNNSLDVASHLPFLFHIVTLLGEYRSINITSINTWSCDQYFTFIMYMFATTFSDETQRVLRLSSSRIFFTKILCFIWFIESEIRQCPLHFVQVLFDNSQQQQHHSFQSNVITLIPNSQFSNERSMTIANAYSPTIEQPERMSLTSFRNDYRYTS